MLAFVLLFGNTGASTACRDFYFDFGSNIGVQIRKLYEPHLYPGAAVLPYFDKVFGNVTRRRNSVCAFGFEANPHHSARLKMLEDIYQAKNWQVHFFTETAVGAVDGTLDFFADGDPKREEWGSSIFDWTRGARKVTVRQINAANIIYNLTSRHARDDASPRNIIAKMDIEGSEYKVLAQLLDRGMLCQSNLTEILIEWHVRMIPKAEQNNAVEFEKKFGTILSRQACNATTIVDLDDESFLHDGKPFFKKK